MLKNTLKNTQIVNAGDFVSSKKSHKKVSWGEKAVIPFKQPPLAKTMTNFRENTKVQVTPSKSILKGDPGPEQT